MNRADKILIISIVVISFVCFIWIFVSKSPGKQALVYYQDKLILTVDLNLTKTYTVKGELGKVVIQTKEGKIKVEEENSPRHLCSRQGWVSTTYESIVCLPNKIVIQITSDESLDAVVK